MFLGIGPGILIV